MITTQNNLEMIRIQKGLSLRDLAKLSGVNATTISQIERGKKKPYPKTIHKLFTALEMPVEDVFVLQRKEAISQ